MTRFAMLPLLFLCAESEKAGVPDQPKTQAEKDEQAILAVERGAFERWAKGDLRRVSGGFGSGGGLL
ncbi:MAG: hypothetical protein QM757_13185 [Paludibaculum sp.]